MYQLTHSKRRLPCHSQVNGPLRVGARQLPPPRAPDETPENKGATYRLGEVGRGVGEDGLAAVVAIGALHPI